MGLIYRAYHKETGQSYIGQTENLEKRKENHLSKINDNTLFHQALRQYGWDSFEWEILEDNISINKLNEREKYWVEYFNSFECGYNQTKGGDYNSRNFKHSEETKKKLSEIKKGTHLSDESLKKRREKFKEKNHNYKPWNKGKGKPKPEKIYKTKEEIHDILSEAHKKRWTEEERKKQSIRCSGEGNPMYGKGYKLKGEKNGRYGKPASEETKAKLRAAWKRRKERMLEKEQIVK